MSTTDDHKAMLPPYVKSREADEAAARGCWPSDYCHRDNRDIPTLRDCDCYACTYTMQQRERWWARVRDHWATAKRMGKVTTVKRNVRTGRTMLVDGVRVPIYRSEP